MGQCSATRRALCPRNVRSNGHHHMAARLNRFKPKRALVLIALLGIGSSSAQAAGCSLLVDHVRAANDRFKDVAVAVAEGYSPIACASGLQGGAMGIHYVSGERLKDGVIDLA